MSFVSRSARARSKLLGGALVCAACSVAERPSPSSDTRPATGDSVAALTAARPAASKSDGRDAAGEREGSAAGRRCDGELALAAGEPAGADAGLSRGERAALLARAKATPVVFLEEPQDTTSDPVVREWRKRLTESTWPGKALAKLLAGFRRHPAFLREVLLTEGYVHARGTLLALALADVVTPSLLFREPRIVIERGSERFGAERNEQGGYVLRSGRDAGKPARLLLFDRVWIEGSDPGPVRHVDLEALQRELGFDAGTLLRAGASDLVFELEYGAARSRALVRRTGARLELVCEDAGHHAEAVERQRALAPKRALALSALQNAILEQVDENLPFDEPKTEFGQEDGKLRQEWRLAYGQGASRYHYNEDRYEVFDSLGRPLVPQVCIDFIFDTFERCAGSWYARKGAPRARTPGRLDFDAAGMRNRRSVEEFLELARRRPDWFELREVPREQQVPLARTERFFSTLYEQRAHYRPGDVVVILGPRDDDQLHYHSFFVFAADPLTGMPTWVAGNSGRPRVRAWAVEMAPAPKRSLFARVRPRLDWLLSVAGPLDEPGVRVASQP